MKVFRIVPDSNNFQKLLPDDTAVWGTGVLTMDCRSKLPGWKAPSVYVHSPRLKRGNFFSLAPGTFVLDEMALQKLRPVMDCVGELLPIRVASENALIVNVLVCVDCLDHENTKWVINQKTGNRILIEKYTFLPERFTQCSLFKIPEMPRSELFTVTGAFSPEAEFKTVVEDRGLTGLNFQEVWSDDSD